MKRGMSEIKSKKKSIIIKKFSLKFVSNQVGKPNTIEFLCKIVYFGINGNKALRSINIPVELQFCS